MKFLKILFFGFLFIIILGCKETKAAGVNVTTSAQIEKKVYLKDYENDFRVITLKNFFDKYSSPLTEYSTYFVYYADIYNLDWRLVPAITGVESTFAKRIPAGSYNAYGWARETRFNSWEESIEVVNKDLREKYLDKGANTLSKIARRYCPPSTTWESGVRFFIKKIDPIAVNFTLE